MRATWAKAPDFADRPDRRAQVRAQTAEDRVHYLDEGLAPLRCQACQATVLVRKSSAQQTSVQWTERPEEHCSFFAERYTESPRPGRPETCPQLTKTIAWAVDEGVIEVPE